MANKLAAKPKFILIISGCVLFMPLFSAEKAVSAKPQTEASDKFYRWTDDKGLTHFSSHPPNKAGIRVVHIDSNKPSVFAGMDKKAIKKTLSKKIATKKNKVKKYGRKAKTTVVHSCVPKGKKIASCSDVMDNLTLLNKLLRQRVTAPLRRCRHQLSEWQFKFCR